MKAKIRHTNIELDVQPCYDETGYFAGFKNDYEYYRAADLVFPDTPDWDKTDWSSFRREAAKDILCALIGHKDSGVGTFSFDSNTKVEHAIAIADRLINGLKTQIKTEKGE